MTLSRYRYTVCDAWLHRLHQIGHASVSPAWHMLYMWNWCMASVFTWSLPPWRLMLICLLCVCSGPNSIAKCSIDPQPDGQYAVTYIPVEVGMFDVQVKWNGKELPGEWTVCVWWFRQGAPWWVGGRGAVLGRKPPSEWTVCGVCVVSNWARSSLVSEQPWVGVVSWARSSLVSEQSWVCVVSWARSSLVSEQSVCCVWWVGQEAPWWVNCHGCVWWVGQEAP